MNNAKTDWAKASPPRAAKESKPSRTRPVHQIRFGHIKAAVWRNETENGVRFSTTFSRLYREGDQWKVTGSFGRDDLLLLAKTADAVHSWIYAQSQENEEDGTPAPGEPQRYGKPEDQRA